MKVTRISRNGVGAIVALFGVAFSTQLVQAQSPPISGEGALRKPLFDLEAVAPRENVQPTGTARLRLFAMPTGFLRDPLGVDNDDPVSGIDTLDGKGYDDDTPGLLVAMGAYNPNFDMRRPDDPRGLGYYKIHSQMQVLDMGRTNISLTLQALTPAGLESGGTSTGPTIFSPAIAWFYDLGAGSALQGYIGQNIHANSRWNENLGSRIHCGVGIQYPVPGLCQPKGDQGLFFVVQAMGRYRCDDRPDSRPAVWELVPGLQWRINENCSISVGASRWSLLNCSWQF